MSYATAPQPLYQAIKNYVTDCIGSGTWTPGTRIPSEAQICKLFSASRMTVNRAIRELSAEGRLTRVQGVGTFVAQPQTQATLLEIRSIGAEIADRGNVHSCQVILERTEPAPDPVARDLEVALQSPVFHVVLVHRENGLPVQMEDRHVNPAAAPAFLEQDFARITPSEYLLGFLPVTEIEHDIKSRLPDDRECDLLQIAPSEPCLELRRRSWAGHRVVTRVRLISPGALCSVGGRFRVGNNGVRPFERIQASP